MNSNSHENQYKPENRETGEKYLGICPYYQRDRGKGVVYCECARFRFPDKVARREIVYGFCAHPTNYKKCALKQMMDHFYERKYNQIEMTEGGTVSHAEKSTEMSAS